MSSKPRFGMVLEYVADIEAAARFYTEVVGLEVERSHPMYVQFSNFAIAGDESLTGGRERELYWIVDDAQAAFNELAPKVDISLPLEQKPFGKVFGIKDPSGQPIYILEWARQRPRQAVGAQGSE